MPIGLPVRGVTEKLYKSLAQPQASPKERFQGGERGYYVVAQRQGPFKHHLHSQGNQARNALHQW